MFDTRLYEAHIPLPLPTSQLIARPSNPPLLSLAPLRNPSTITTLFFFLSLPLSLFLSLFTQNLTLFSSSSMAQKTENEETEFKVPETITLCVNNCGVTGNPATNNMCQNCFTAFTASTATTSSAAAGIASPSARSAASARPQKRSFPEEPSSAADPPSSDQNTPSEAKRVVNRCSGCRRKVGLTGFRCRCGDLFCAEHRYSDRHDCSYDYKAAGREAIARENPVVRAAKIVKV
ncbi:hypothetical protein VNO80_26533 [Phaseolus coccineus]|uniref:Zinc finger A20 and AN1 domain-containing stress-associated protein 5 n=1 Tax=Phaseolus coccineus TaxID=3886 RepID=A0AAN9LEY0_PHACN